MISARIGLSEAGKRIHSAGLTFAASKKPFPDPVVVAAVQRALDQFVIGPEPVVATTPSCREIAARVAAAHNLTLSDILARTRGAAMMMVRFEAYYRCLTGTLSTVTEVGARLGNRDRGTITSGVSRYCAAHGLPMPRGLAERRHN